MKHPSQDDLLGYVLGALDAQEQREVQQLIDSDPELEEQLLAIKASISPLDCLDAPVGARPGLARRTCELVASLQKDTDFSETRLSASRSLVDSMVASANMPPAEKPHAAATMESSGYFERCSPPRTWSITDFIIGIAACAVLAGILFPAISHVKHNSEVLACQNNLQTLGKAFMQYSDCHGGCYVEIPSEGNLAYSGCWAPILKTAGLIECDQSIACPGVDSDKPMCIPGSEQIEKSSGIQLAYYRRTTGGDYGYTLGHMQGDMRCSPGRFGRDFLVVLSDRPSQNLEGRRSANHRGYGQNCLFEDGHVRFVPGHAYGGDPLFMNEYGIVAPGCHPGDNVIAPSHLSPVLPTSTVKHH